MMQCVLVLKTLVDDDHYDPYGSLCGHDNGRDYTMLWAISLANTDATQPVRPKSESDDRITEDVALELKWQNKQSRWTPAHVVDEYARDYRPDYHCVTIPFTTTIISSSFPSSFYLVIPRVNCRLDPTAGAFAIATSHDNLIPVDCGARQLQSETNVGSLLPFSLLRVVCEYFSPCTCVFDAQLNDRGRTCLEGIQKRNPNATLVVYECSISPHVTVDVDGTTDIDVRLIGALTYCGGQTSLVKCKSTCSADGPRACSCFLHLSDVSPTQSFVLPSLSFVLPSLSFVLPSLSFVLPSLSRVATDINSVSKPSTDFLFADSDDVSHPICPVVPWCKERSNFPIDTRARCRAQLTACVYQVRELHQNMVNRQVARLYEERDKEVREMKTALLRWYPHDAPTILTQLKAQPLPTNVTLSHNDTLTLQITAEALWNAITLFSTFSIT
jgi:hypothetical protein